MNFGAKDFVSKLPFEDIFGNKLERALDFIKNNSQIKVPNLQLSPDGSIFDMEGNHRFRAMKEIFKNKAVISVSQNDLNICKKQDWFLDTYDNLLSNERRNNLNTFMADSKVVDSNNKPLIVYHGTRGDFNYFDLKKRGSSTVSDDSKHGFFFSNNTDVASSYSELSMNGWNKYQKAIDDFKDKKISYKEMKEVEDWYNNATYEERFGRPDGANIIPVYLDFKNPKIISHIDRFEPKAFEFEIIYAKEQGYDSIIFENIVDDISYMGASTNRGNTYVAFEPSQIKSAFDIKFDAKSILLNEKNSILNSKDTIGENFLDKFIKKYEDSTNLKEDTPLKESKRKKSKCLN